MEDEDWDTVVVEVEVGVQVSTNMSQDGAFDSAQGLVDDMVGEYLFDVGGMEYRGVSDMEYDN